MKSRENSVITKPSNQKLHAYILYSAILVITFIILLTTNVYNPVEHLYFKQGDNYIYIVDSESGEKTEIIVFQERFIFGTSYFTIEENEYLGYVEADKIEPAHFEYYFNYIKLNNLDQVVDTTEHSVKFDLDKSLDTSPRPHLNRLNVQSINNTLIFSTIFSKGTTQSNSITSIMQFDINGKILNIIDYSIDTYDDAKILDFKPYSNSSYIILSTLGKGEAINSESNHLIMYSTSGEATNFTNLEKEVSTIGFNPIQNILLTSDRGGQSLDQRTLNGKFIKTVSIGIEPFEMSFMYDKYMLIQDYRNPVYTAFEIIRIIVFLIIFLAIIPAIIIYLTKLYSKYKNQQH